MIASDRCDDVAFQTKLSGSFSVAPIHAMGNVYGAETNAMIIRKFIKK
jgi:hypothetical protein